MDARVAPAHDAADGARACRLNDSIVKQRGHDSSPVFLMSAPGRPSLNSNSQLPIEGSGAPAGAGACETPGGQPARGTSCDRPLPPLRSEGRRLPALHVRRFLSPWAVLPGETASSIRTASGAVATAPSSSHSCSHRRRPVVMPADGWPGPPGGRVTSPARGRRISLTGFPARPDEPARPHLRPCPSPLLRPRHVSGDAPRRAGRTYNRLPHLYVNRPTIQNLSPTRACVMAGLVPAIPIGRAPCLPERGHRDKPGGDRH